MLNPPLVFFVIALLSTLVRSDYTIDDSNYSTLKFSENPGGPVWGPFGSDTNEVLEIRLPNGTMQTVDATQCFDGTYTYAACSASNNCNVQFSFTGSGITVYVLRAGPQGMSASLTIDSGSATTATLDVPPAPQYYIPRQVLFNVQNLVSGTHSAVMTVQDWNGGFSGMMLDYININQASVSGPTTSAPPNPSTAPTTNGAQPQSATSSNPQSTGSSTGTHSGAASSAVIASVFSSQSGGTASPSGTPSGNGTSSTVSPSPKNSNTAPIVGGAVGGSVGLLALVALALLCYRRRRQQVLAANDRPGPLLPQGAEARFTTLGVGGSDPFGSSAALSAGRLGTSRPLQSWTETEGSTHNLTVGDTSSTTSPITNLSHARMTSTGNDSATSSVPVSAGVGAAAAAVAAIVQQRAAAASYQPGHQPAAITAGAAVTPVVYPNEKMRPSSSGALQQSDTAGPDAADARPNPVLTDNQADFVNSLFNNNVPAPVVARVLERMLANPQGANGTGYNDPELRPHLGSGTNAPWRATMSDIGDGETTIGTAPPSYDYVRAQ